MEEFDVLFICPKFYGYECRIHNCLMSKGLHVKEVFYNEADFFKLNLYCRFILFLYRIVLSIFFGSYESCKSYWAIKDYLINVFCKDKLNKYIYREIKNVYCKRLFVIKGYLLDIELIKEINSDIKILYQWDSVVRYPSVTKTYSYYDKTFTFDPKDSAAGFGIYMPCFYDYTSNGSELETHITNDFKYDIVFVGVYTKHRYELVNLINKKCNSLGLNSFLWLYKRKSIFDFLGCFYKKSFVNNTKLSIDYYNEILTQSHCLIDITHEGQFGSTQRVLDGLARSKVIISNLPNSNKLENYFTIDEFLTWDINSYRNKSFITSSKINRNFMSSLDISNWLEEVVSL